MNDFRLLIPALVFWIIRVGWINPKYTAVILAFLLILIAYLIKTRHQKNILTTTIAGAMLGAIVGIAVSLILPAPQDIYYPKRPGAENRFASHHLPAAAENSFQLNGDIFAGIRENFRQAAGSFAPDTAGILQGIVLGDASLLSDTLKTQVKLAGLAHLVAISGAHISLLIGMAVFFLGRRKPKLTAVLAGIFLFFLVLLVGLSASVLRAAMMGAIVLIALAFGRGSGAIAALSLGIIIAAAFWPDLAQGIGFQMSAVTTAGIVIFSPRITAIPAIKNRPWLQLAIVPLVAGTVVIPMSAQLQTELSIFSVLANIAVAPVIPIITVGGLICAVLSPIFPMLASVLLFPCALGAQWVEQVAFFAAFMPAFCVSPWIVAGIQLIILTAVVVWGMRQSRSDCKQVIFAVKKHSFWNRRRIVLASAFCGLVLSIFLVPRIFPCSRNLTGN
ncbi:ComEC/Rec2 family competence protein [Arcanobacterium hippocoleae]